MGAVWQKEMHGVRRRTEPLDRAAMARLLLLIAIVVVLAFVYMGLLWSTTRLGGELWALNERLIEIQRQNSLIEAEIARLSSIPVLQVRSVELGYMPAEQVEYLIVGGR